MPSAALAGAGLHGLGPNRQRTAVSADARRNLDDLGDLRFGLEPNRRSLETIIDLAFGQKLIPRRFSVDELFDDTTRALE